VLRKCDPINARKIDLLFLSVGGNDVGFSRLLANAVLADQSLLRKLGGWIGQVHGLDEASLQLDALITRYKSLNRAIHHILHIPWEESDRVILAAYPGLALLGDGSEVCPDGRAGMEVLSDFKMSAVKVRVGTWIADKLHHAMHDAADQYGWTFVESHRREFIGRGICAGTAYDGGDIADDLRLPRKTEAGWRPYNPVDYRAYASRQRWFRTPNDAYMTANFHVAASILQKVLKINALSWFQLVLAATYSGAFHPTAEGQAAMADAVVYSARAVLNKYSQSDRTRSGARMDAPGSKSGQLVQ
jgi:lysophospholipase L1-like esterase